MSGRGLVSDGNNGSVLKANGSLTMENLMRGMAHMSEEGFTPNVLLMHPLLPSLTRPRPILTLLHLCMVL